MIRVTIELLPGGSEDEKSHLGTIDIWNDLSSSNLRSVGNYKARVSRKGQPKSTWKGAEVKGFPRKQKGAYDLLYLVLKAVVGDRNKT